MVHDYTIQNTWRRNPRSQICKWNSRKSDCCLFLYTTIDHNSALQNKLSRSIPEHHKVMASGTGDYKEMPDQMAILQPRIDCEKNDPDCVGQPTRDQ